MRAIVWTIYNPAHLFANLRERGYEVHTKYPKSDRPKFEIRKAVSKGVAAIEGVNFYLALIEQGSCGKQRSLKGLTGCSGRHRNWLLDRKRVLILVLCTTFSASPEIQIKSL